MALGPWIDLDGPALDGPEALPARCDVAVVGGGLAGVSTALFLAEAGVDVVLVEALPALGLRESGRGLGLVEAGLVEHPPRTIASLGDERAGALLRFASRNLDLLEERGLLDRCGGLWAALDKREPGEIDQSAAALQRLGFEAAVLDSDAADRKIGGFNFGPALWRPDSGRIEPVAALHALADAARAAGATLVGDAEITHIDDGPDGVVLTHAEGRLTASAVVIAAGIDSGNLEPALDGRLIPVREQALMTAPVFAWYATPGHAGHGYTSWRQLPDGHLLVSGCRWATPHLEVGETDDEQIVDRIQAKLESFFRLHFPAAEETPVVDRWAWVFAQGSDGLPFVGPLPGSPQRLACCGFGGNSASFAVAAARGLVDGLLTGTSGVPESLNPVRIIRWRGNAPV